MPAIASCSPSPWPAAGRIDGRPHGQVHRTVRMQPSLLPQRRDPVPGEGGKPARGRHSSASCGGSAATSGWSLPVLPVFEAPPGEPRSCDDLNMVAMGHPNVNLCLSLLVPWAISAPGKFARILGEALRFVGPERIIWGTDSAGFGVQVAAAVAGLRDFQIPEDMQQQYGYPAITDDDRARIFGGNLAGLLGIEAKRRGPFPG